MADAPPPVATIGGPLTAAAGRPSPAPASERRAAMDVLRGVALLGILPVNVLTGFALPSAVYFNPALAGGFEGADYAVWLLTHALLEMKMMAIFSMLFGAGALIMLARTGARVGELAAAGVYYRRIGWLGAIGLAHAYGLWAGDILLMYAVCAAPLFLVRRWPPVALILTGAGLILASGAFILLMGGIAAYAQRHDPETYAHLAATIAPPSRELEAEVAARRGSFLDVWWWNATMALGAHLVNFPLIVLWRVLGLMLLGAGLMKLDVFTGARSVAFYGALAAAGYAIGLPVVALGALGSVRHGFEVSFVYLYGFNANNLGSVLVALGHVGVVMLVCRLGLLRRAQSGLAAVGRLSLSNYLLQTVICASLFFGWGLGLFNRLDRTELMLVVCAVWGAQIAASVLWLRAFRFGPAEWLLRSLTYGARQPMRRGGDLAAPTE